VLLVGAGGFVGTIARYLLSGFVQEKSGGAFPFGTLTVNVLGCLVVGVVAELAESKGLLSADARLFAVVGVLGGFTTFSAFGHETVSLLRERTGTAALVYVLASVVLGLGAVWLGRFAAHGLAR